MRAFIVLAVLAGIPATAAQDLLDNYHQYDMGEAIHDVCAVAYWTLSQAADEERHNNSIAYLTGMSFRHMKFAGSPELGEHTLKVLTILQTEGSLTLDELWTFTRTVCVTMLENE